MPELTQEYLKECLDYDTESGLFTWKTRPINHFRTERGWRTFNSQCSGRTPGCIRSDGYVIIRLNGTHQYAHRLAWLHMHGNMPTKAIDHINHDTGDNRISNLREAGHRENLMNMGLRSSNTSGVNGVVWSKDCHKWLAQISVKGKCIYLGVFDDIGDAEAARKEADIKYGYHTNHGKKDII